MFTGNEGDYVEAGGFLPWTKRMRAKIINGIRCGILTTTDPLTPKERLDQWKGKNGPEKVKRAADKRTEISEVEVRELRPGHDPKRGEKVVQMDLFRAVPMIFFCCTFGLIFKDGFEPVPTHFDGLWQFSTWCLEVEVLNDRVLMTADVGFDGRIKCPGIPEGVLVDATVDVGLRGVDPQAVPNE